jgi:hypothetical protein
MGLSPQQIVTSGLQGVAIGAPIAGGIRQGRAAEAAAGAESAAARYNARLAELEAGERARYIRREGHREATSAFVRASAGGVRVEGTPADQLARMAYETEREAVNAEIEGRNTARLDRARASSVRTAGKISARNALIGGATQAAQFGARLFGGF